MKETESNSDVRREFSVVEKAWLQLPRGMGLIPTRSVEYDRPTMLFHSPVRYVGMTLQLQQNGRTDDLPSDEWIKESFSSLVLKQRDKPTGNTPGELQSTSRSQISDPLVHDLLENCEAQCVYTSIIDGVIQDSGKTLPEKILDLLGDDLLGNKENRENVVAEDVQDKVSVLVENKLPLQFVVPAFPFKDQNLFRTEAPADHVDLGEVFLLIKMHVLALSISQIYPYGVEWIIVSDGIVYSPFFRVDANLARTYIERVRDYRNHLNMQKTVHILDLKELVVRFDSFDKVEKYIRKRLEELDDKEIQTLLAIFSNEMKWNINTRDLAPKYSRDDIWKVLTDQMNDGESITLRGLYDELSGWGRKTAIEYAAFNLAMKKLSVIENCFPLAIRATTHAKRGQIAIPRVGVVAPWNGTPLLLDESNGPRSVRCEPLYRILMREGAKSYSLYNDKYPFYYKSR